MVPGAVALRAAGIALTLPTPLWCVVLGLCVLTVGFFAAHGVASGWVASRAQLGIDPHCQAVLFVGRVSDPS